MRHLQQTSNSYAAISISNAPIVHKKSSFMIIFISKYYWFLCRETNSVQPCTKSEQIHHKFHERDSWLSVGFPPDCACISPAIWMKLRWSKAIKHTYAKGRACPLPSPLQRIFPPWEQNKKPAIQKIAGFACMGWWVVRDSNTRPTD